MDMLRFKQFTIGKAWEADYGTPENIAEFYSLIRIETSAGHGGGKPISKVLEEVRDVHTFILQNMGVEIPTSFD